MIVTMMMVKRAVTVATIDIEDDDLFDNDDDENEWIDIDYDDSNPTASRKAVDSRAGSSTQSTNL